MPRTVLHVDMDAFYAAIEQRDRPELRGKPVIVGADPKGGSGRGVVSTASYEARPFGVHSAMPISQAYRLCPQGIFVPPDMERYGAVSRQIFEVMGRFTDLVEPISVDEAFLDVTGSRKALGDGVKIARGLKAAIRQATQLTASVGVSTCKLVAKIASDLRKPDGLVVVPPGQEAAFLAPLPVRRLWGVGPKAEERLSGLGVRTIGDLAALDPQRLEQGLGSHGHDLMLLARGLDEREVVADGADAKSVGAEHTFDVDLDDAAELRRTLLFLCDTVAGRLRQTGLKGRTLTLKYRDATFHTVTRAETLGSPTDAGDVLFEAAFRLFQAAHGRRKVRLLGVSASGFQQRQLDLFPEPQRPADRLRDAVAERFGKGALTRASLLRPTSPRPPGRGSGTAS